MRQAEQKDKRGLTVKDKKRKEKRGEGGERRRRERGGGRGGALTREQMPSFTPIIVAKALPPDWLRNTGWLVFKCVWGSLPVQVRCLKQLTKPRKEADTKRMDSTSTVQCLHSIWHFILCYCTIRKGGITAKHSEYPDCWILNGLRAKQMNSWVLVKKIIGSHILQYTWHCC